MTLLKRVGKNANRQNKFNAVMKGLLMKKCNDVSLLKTSPAVATALSNVLNII